MQRRLWFLFALGCAALANAQTAVDQVQAAYEALAKGPVWVHPSAAKMVDVAAIQATADSIAPMQLKVLVVPTLGGKWAKGDQELRGSYAKWLLTERLTLNNALVIVYTKRGIGSYSDRISDSRLARLNNEATKYAQQNNFTPAITWLAKEGARNATAASRTKTGATAAFILIPIAIGGGVWMATAGRKRLAMMQAKARTEEVRTEVLEGLNYVDSYADLLPSGHDADRVRELREEAYTLYEQARSIESSAKRPEDLATPQQMYRDASDSIALAKDHILAANGGSKVAYAIRKPSNVEPEDVDSTYEPVTDTCIFCSRPGQGDLTPVTMNIDGKKRTVLVCPEDLADLQRGEEPKMRGINSGGRFIPWYGVRGYNPYLHYGTGSFVFDVMAISALTSMMNPFAWTIAGLGGMGGGMHPHDSFGGGIAGSGGGLGELDTSGSFGGADFGGSWGTGGGTDFGGDFGGGVDFGGDF